MLVGEKLIKECGDVHATLDDNSEEEAVEASRCCAAPAVL